MSASDPFFDAVQAWRVADERSSVSRAELSRVKDALSGSAGGDRSALLRSVFEFEAANEPITEERLASLAKLYETEPTTLAGLAALVEVFLVEDLDEVKEVGIAGSAVVTICNAVLAIVRGGGGANVLPAGGTGLLA